MPIGLTRSRARTALTAGPKRCRRPKGTKKARPDEPQRGLTRIHVRSLENGGEMMRRALIALALITLSRAVFAQSPQSSPRFDAADISLRTRTGTTNQPTMT